MKGENGSVRDQPWAWNPSCGLGIWGPLVPASDRPGCLMALAGLQFVGGVSLWLQRRRPPTRSLWAHRGIRVLKFFAGSYLMFFASMEGIRFMLPYDPWVEDAKKARKEAGPSRSILRWWFGPKDYRACSWNEWKSRIENYFARVEAPLTELSEYVRLHQQVRVKNREMLNSILHEIKDGSFQHEPIDGMATVEVDEGIDVESLGFEDLDLWARFDALTPFNVVVLPHSIVLPPLNSPTRWKRADRLMQNVAFAPIPDIVRKF